MESKEEKLVKKIHGNEAIQFLKERTKLDDDLMKAEFEAKKRNDEAVNNHMEQQFQLLSQQQKDNARQQEQVQNILKLSYHTYRYVHYAVKHILDTFCSQC